MLPRSMRRVLLAGILVAAARCVDDLPCPTVECVATTVLTVKDTAGTAVTQFSGVVESGEEPLQFSCGAADGGSMPLDGGAQQQSDVKCDGNEVRIVNRAFGAEIRVTINGAGKAFDGVVSLATEYEPVGRIACATSCARGVGTVVLR